MESSNKVALPRGNRSITYLMFAIAVGLVAFGAAAMPHFRPHVAPPPLPPLAGDDTPRTSKHPTPRRDVPRVEVVFALDTTGSMSGLIDGAKRKIWSMVDFISSGQPEPEVRIGLVAYRDIGDAYVTRFYDLSDDVDEVFKNLSSFQAGGGGDTPEHVAKALSDAVERTHWSDGKNVVKLVYLVGDAPPHTDYDDGYDYRTIAKKAGGLGIRINTIRCGDDRETERYFAEIASLGQGQFASIAQTGGVTEHVTPYDDKLATLNRKLMDTAVGYGEGGAAMRARMATTARAAPSVIADRASFFGRIGKASAGASRSADLVEAFGAEGASAVAAAPAAALPAEMVPMSPVARVEYVAAKKREREAVLSEIKTVAAQRHSFLKSGAGPAAAHADGFDDRVRKSLADESRGVVKFE